MNDLEKRMRRYELPTRIYLPRRMPLIARIDGKKFSTFTRKIKKYKNSKVIYDFSESLMRVFEETCKKLLEVVQGSICIYSQSDEISILITDFKYLDTEAQHDNNLTKLISDLSSFTSNTFNYYLYEIFECDPYELQACFDVKINTYPEDDVNNYFVWRQNDCCRNSLSKFSRNFFSQKKLLNKKKNDMHEMLHSIDKNWTKDLPDWAKNGIFITKNQENKIITYKYCPIFKENKDIITPLMIKNYNYSTEKLNEKTS